MSTNPTCLIVTPKIRELAAKFPNETVESVKNLVSLWQAKIISLLRIFQWDMNFKSLLRS